MNQVKRVLSRDEIIAVISALLKKYGAESALLFGSYARGEADANSDIDVVIYGGPLFKASSIFMLAEELRELTGHDVDAFEIREVNKGTPFYNSIMSEGVRIA